MTKTVVLFSGGLSSTYMLWRMLDQTDDKIVALQMAFPNKEEFISRAAVHSEHNHGGHWDYNRVEAEKITSTEVLAWLKENTRSFDHIFVDTATPMSEKKTVKGGSRYAARVGGEYAKQNGFDRIMIGREVHQVIPGKDHDAVVDRQGTFDDSIKGAHHKIIMEYPLVDWNVGKPHFFAEAPQELMSLANYCNHPTVEDGKVIPCGVTNPVGICRKGCYRVADIKYMLSLGATPDTIMDLYLRRLRLGPYEDLPSVDKLYIKRRL